MKAKTVILGFLFTIGMMSCEKDDEHILNVKACFSYNVTEVVAGEVQFKNCSENATTYRWNFGDCQTSTEKNPKHVFLGNFPFSVSLVAINKISRDSVFVQVTDNIMVKKPNIYIYPLSPINISVKIEFPLGGNVAKSIPDYNDGWTVNIDPNGRIDNKFNYFFYESIQPNIFQYKKGWCVSKSELGMFFKQNMSSYNFSNEEINDFIEYWIPKLEEYDYYMIYPQTNDIIDSVIRLKFSIQPNNINRLFYGVVGLNNYVKVEEPTIVKFKRDGFFIMEWGVFDK